MAIFFYIFLYIIYDKLLILNNKNNIIIKLIFYQYYGGEYITLISFYNYKLYLSIISKKKIKNMLSSFLSYCLLLLALISSFLIIYNNNIKSVIKLNFFKCFVVAYTINNLLKLPMHLFCEKLELMPFYYIWCAIVGCLVLFIISTIRNNDNYNNGWYFVRKFLLIVFTLALYDSIFHISILIYIFVFIPDYWQLIILEFWKEHSEYLICNTNVIIPEDPLNQLNNIGYNRNGSNQPIAGNIARAMDLSYAHYGPSLRDDMLPANVKRFLVDYLLDNDKARYDKLMEGVNLHNGDKPKWSKIHNVSPIRNGLRSLP